MMEPSKPNMLQTQRQHIPPHQGTCQDNDKSCDTKQQQKETSTSTQIPCPTPRNIINKKRPNIDTQCPSTSPTEAESEVQEQKRLKLQQRHSSSIIEICTTQSALAFEGDVLVTYGPAFSKNPASPTKTPIVHVDLVDSHGQMTITAKVTNKLIETYLPKLSPGASVRLTEFIIKKKSPFERGDADYCLHLTARTCIETIEKVCKQRKLTPDVTISELLHSTNPYPFGTLAVLVTGHSQSATKFHLHIRDGETINDTASVTVSDYHSEAFATLQQIIASSTTPLLLLKNVVRSGPIGTNIIKSTPSTFIDHLNDDCMKAALQNLVSSNIQVSGTLKPRNAYLPPYQLVCITCHQTVSATQLPATNTARCLTCGKNTTFKYHHFLQCIVENDDDIVNCNMPSTLLEQHLPQLAAVPFETYKKDMSTVLYLLRKFEIHGTFTIAMNDIILSIAKENNNTT